MLGCERFLYAQWALWVNWWAYALSSGVYPESRLLCDQQFCDITLSLFETHQNALARKQIQVDLTEKPNIRIIR